MEYDDRRLIRPVQPEFRESEIREVIAELTAKRRKRLKILKNGFSCCAFCAFSRQFGVLQISSRNPNCEGSGFALGLPQPRDAVARFPLAAFFEQLDAFKAFEHIPFATHRGRRAQTPML
jgi:hypothetical protein